MICMQIGQRKSLSGSDVEAGNVSPDAAAEAPVSAAAALEASGLTTAGTTGPAESSSMRLVTFFYRGVVVAN